MRPLLRTDAGRAARSRGATARGSLAAALALVAALAAGAAPCAAAAEAGASEPQPSAPAGTPSPSGGAAPSAAATPAATPVAAVSPGSTAPGEPSREAAAGRGYVGAAVCGRCHAAELQRWRGSDHDRAMEVATAETVLGDFSGVELAAGEETWRFFRRGGRPFVNARGPDGQRADFAVRYTFGVRPLQQYLVELPGGRLQALTAAWDTRPAAAGGQRWIELSEEPTRPGDPLHWTGDAFTWNRMCADCHSTDLRKGFLLGDDRYETRWSEIDVACEACHGPGAAHVDWAEGGSPAAADRGLAVSFPEPATWVMNESTGIAERRGTPDRREIEVCAPCHARRSVIAPAEPGGRFLDAYRPTLLDEGLFHADGQMLDEVYVYGPFLQSRMYAAGVTCSDCHDPHGLELLAPGNALCARCHLPARFDVPAHTHHEPGSPGAQCVDCHMRAVTYMSVDDRHDHSFRVPRPDLTVDLGVPNACGDCHADRPATWARDVVQKWSGGAPRREHYGRALDAGRRGLAGADGQLAAVLGDAKAPAIARATAVSLLRRVDAAPGRAALESALADEDPLVRMAAAEAADGLPPADRVARVAPLLRDPVRSVRLAAAVALASLPEADLDAAARTSLAAALTEYRRAQAQALDEPQAHVNLALIALARGDHGAAERAYRDAIRIGPYFIPAHVNLADLMRLRGDDGRAEEALRAGLRAVPGSADLHHSLGLALVRRRAYADAIAELARAATLAPERARFAYVHAVALHSTGEVDAAIGVLEDARTRHPNDRDILSALATMERDRGNLSAALGWARQLVALEPHDPRIRALAEDLEHRAATSAP